MEYRRPFRTRKATEACRVQILSVHHPNFVIEHGSHVYSIKHGLTDYTRHDTFRNTAFHSCYHPSLLFELVQLARFLFLCSTRPCSWRNDRRYQWMRLHVFSLLSSKVTDPSSSYRAQSKLLFSVTTSATILALTMQNAACRTALLQSARRALTLSCRKADVSPTISIAKANLISGRSHHVRTSRRNVVRSYATESAALPRSFLLKTPSPPSPTTQAQHPESAASVSTSIDGLLQDFHFHIRSHATRSKECASTATLYDQLSERAGRMLDDELAYEDKPKTADRRVPINTRTDNWLNACELVAARLRGRSVVEVEDDGLALVSHVIASEPPSTSWSLGFVIRTVQGTTYIVSCSHTLESVSECLKGYARQFELPGRQRTLCAQVWLQTPPAL